MRLATGETFENVCPYGVSRLLLAVENAEYALARIAEIERAKMAQLNGFGTVGQGNAPLKGPVFDHQYVAGPYGVCRRCGQDKHAGPSAPEWPRVTLPEGSKDTMP